MKNEMPKNFQIRKEDREEAMKILEKAFLASAEKNREEWFDRNFSVVEDLRVWLTENSENLFSVSDARDIKYICGLGW